MLFTQEEVRQVLIDNEGRWYHRPEQADRFTQSSNFSIISDYLTGRINALNALQPDEWAYYYQPLVKLIKDYVNPGAGDIRVMDVVQHPAMQNYIAYSMLLDMLRRVMNASSDEQLNGLLARLQQLGANADEVFMGAICQAGSITSAESQAKENTPYGRFLRAGFTTTRFPSRRPTVFRHGSSAWSMTYFFLLEQTNAAAAIAYMADCIFDPYSHVLDFAIQLRDGALLKSLESEVAKRPEPNIAYVKIKMQVLSVVFDQDPEFYRYQMENYAQKILQDHATAKNDSHYQTRMRIEPRSATPGPEVEFVAAAIYYLLKMDQAKGLAALDALLEAKVSLTSRVFEVVRLRLGADAITWYGKGLEKAPKGTDLYFYQQMIASLQTYFSPETYLIYLWQMAGSTLRTLREKIAGILTEKDPDAEQKAIQMLSEKNAEKRQTAAMILQSFSSDAAKQAVGKLLNTETNDTARDILLQTVADNLPTERDYLNAIVEAAAARGKLKKPQEDWLAEEQLPPLYFVTGEPLNTNEIRFLFYRMSRVKEMRSDVEAKCLLRFIDKARSAPFASKLIQLFIDNGGKSDHKWLMALSALLGNEEIVDKLKNSINSWVEGSRYKMAEYGVGALALQGSDKSLRWVEWYSRKYRTKKANVGSAALLALETAAEELGITTHELGDRIVPDFGFDGLFKTFTADGAEYRAFIDNKFKIAFFNEDNKKLKTIPAAADESLKEEFKSIAKEIRDIVKSQSPRLEYYLIIQRRWTWPQWQQFFLHNPVMFIYATRLVWGVYDTNGQLQSAFLCNDDTSLINIYQEEIEAPENAIIGMVHPAQLEPALLQQWQQLVFDLGIEPAFPQLERVVPSLEGIDLAKPVIDKFSGKRMATGSIRSTLERFGWNKGATGDGGFIESMNLLYLERQLEAILELEGVAVGYGWSNEEILGRLYFIDRTKMTNKWSAYIRDESDPKLVPANQVPSIFLNEAIAAIEKIKPFTEQKEG